MSEEIQKEIVELVDEVTDKKTFSIVEAINNRSYPHTSINVYLDELLAFNAAELDENISELSNSENPEDVEKSLALRDELDALIEQMNANKYVFNIYGISEGEREKILNIAQEKYPVEYDEDKNPYTGAVTRTERENADRDRLFTILLWKSQIRNVVAPDGSVQDSFTEHDIEQLRTALPVASIAEINSAIEKVRAATAIFMAKVNQDFLAKR